jgi:hypothetical protein
VDEAGILTLNSRMFVDTDLGSFRRPSSRSPHNTDYSCHPWTASSGYHHRAGGNAAVGDFAGFAVDLGRLADVTPIEITLLSSTITPSTTSERAPMKQLSPMMVGLACRFEHAAERRRRTGARSADLRAGADSTRCRPWCSPRRRH